MRVNYTDKGIILLFYLSIIIGLYYNGLSQSSGQEGTMTPVPFLLLPFGIAFLQLIRIASIRGKVKLDTLGKSWLYILLYYIFAFIVSYNIYGINQFKYNTYWFVVCPPLSWLYFSIILKENIYVSNLLIKWSFWVYILLSGISLFFIPRSINYMGYYSSLNSGYYVLFAYPMVMLEKNKIKKIIASILLVLIMLLSLKRGGIISVALAFAIFILFSSKAKLFKKIVVAIICIGSLIYIIPQIDKATNGTLTVRYEFTQNRGDEEGRAAMYPILWNSICQSSPMDVVFGHGHNAVVSNNVLQGLSAHNDYLEFLYDYGLIGLALLVIFHLKIISITVRARNSETVFMGAVFASTSIVVLSMVSIVYAYYYFTLIIPFWCVVNNKV